MRYSLLALTAALAVGWARAAPDHPNMSSEPIEQTNLRGETDSEHPGVVGVAGQGTTCTGSLIAQNLVVTARHCIADLPGSYVQCGVTLFGDPDVPCDVLVTTDQAMGYGSTWRGAVEVLVPEESSDPCGYDIALLIVDGNIDDVAPMVPRIDHQSIVGEVFTAAGYGERAENMSGSGTRWFRDGLEVRCAYPQWCGPSIANGEFVADAGICRGDSDGPAVDSLGRVFGVVSRGARGCLAPTYGDISIWKDWLIETAHHAAELGGYQVPSWALTGETGPAPARHLSSP